MFGQPKRQTVSCATLLAELDEIAHAAAVGVGVGSAPKQVPGSHGHGAQGAGLGLSHSPVRYTHGSPTTPLSNMNRRRRRSSGASPQPPDYFIGQDAGALAPLGPATPALGQFGPAPARASRLKDEWKQLETLGHGGFGSVFKARLLLDGGVYAVKRVELRGVRSGPGRRRENEKIFREVGALAKLSHRYVVRYYTAWIEEDGSVSPDGGLSEDEEGSDDDEDNDVNTEDGMFDVDIGPRRYLYIQMASTVLNHVKYLLTLSQEFVEQQTLKEVRESHLLDRSDF
jgi:serine/threonine protein kinase